MNHVFFSRKFLFFYFNKSQRKFFRCGVCKNLWAYGEFQTYIIFFHRKFLFFYLNKAQTKYNKALSRGQTAMLMMEDRQSGDIFEIKLGNLPPYTEAKLTLAYVTELPVEPKGVVVFTLPAVLNPRYTPGRLMILAPSLTIIHFLPIIVFNFTYFYSI